MSDDVAITLPGGSWVGSAHVREARLRPLTAEDDAFLAEDAAALSTAHRTTALLARCLTELGPRPVTPASVSALTVGDREAVLLHLRLLTVGDRLQCVAECPVEGCGERMDLDLRVTDLLLPPYRRPRQRYEMSVSDRHATYRVAFRLPTGADQEEAAPVARRDVRAAVRLVLRRCVQRVEREGPTGERPRRSRRHPVPAAVARALPGRMATLDPQAEIRLELSCVACGVRFSTLLDAGDFVAREAVDRARGTFRDVHELAAGYGWSERDIMAMTPRRRRTYLDLLAEATDRAEAAWTS